MKNKIKIFLVDDHPVVRQGISQMIQQELDMIVCGEAEDGYHALDAIEKLNPDIALVDISLKGMNGIELIKNVKVRFPKLPILVLSMHDETLYARRALRAGAMGFIMKQEAPEKILDAIRRVINGGIYLSEKMGSKILHQLVDGRSPVHYSPVERLSDRELEVLFHIGHGHGTRQIAKELHLSIKTIESYRAHMRGCCEIRFGFWFRHINFIFL